MSYKEDCVFCRITKAIEPATVVRAWNDAIAIIPLNPVTPGHVLVMPLQHVDHALENPEVTAATMRRACELASPSCNLITSVGANATQTIKHLHIHIVPREWGDGLKLPWTDQMKQQNSPTPQD